MNNLYSTGFIWKSIKFFSTITFHDCITHKEKNLIVFLLFIPSRTIQWYEDERVLKKSEQNSWSTDYPSQWLSPSRANDRLYTTRTYKKEILSSLLSAGQDKHVFHAEAPMRLITAI